MITFRNYYWAIQKEFKRRYRFIPVVLKRCEIKVNYVIGIQLKYSRNIITLEWIFFYQNDFFTTTIIRFSNLIKQTVFALDDTLQFGAKPTYQANVPTISQLEWSMIPWNYVLRRIYETFVRSRIFIFFIFVCFISQE